MDRFLIEWKALLKCIANIKLYVWRKLNKILILSLFPAELGVEEGSKQVCSTWPALSWSLNINDNTTDILLPTSDTAQHWWHQYLQIVQLWLWGGQLSGKLKLNKIVAIATTCIGIGWVTYRQISSSNAPIPAIIYPTFNIKPLLPTATQATK